MQTVRLSAPIYAAIVGHALCAGELAAQDEKVDVICKGELVTFPLPPFELFDENLDDTLDGREAADCEILGRLFSRLDLDANEVLSPLEYDAFPVLWTRYARTFKDLEDLE